MYSQYVNCKICPRECGVNRYERTGVCGAGAGLNVSKIMLHYFEEPPISGVNGSGAIFFGGCNLRCGYCQNGDISRAAKGKTYLIGELVDEALKLEQAGANNINLVTAGHYMPELVEFLHRLKKTLKIPVVYNTSAYEKPEAIKMLQGLVDIYLPDYKYASPDIAQKYSCARDYPEVAESAIAQMLCQTGEYLEKDGIAVKGVIIRHLVLPGNSLEGVAVIERIYKLFKGARVSIMRQYTPEFNNTGYPELNRKVTTLEYNRVLNAAINLGLKGFMQQKGCETSEFTPKF